MQKTDNEWDWEHNFYFAVAIAIFAIFILSYFYYGLQTNYDRLKVAYDNDKDEIAIGNAVNRLLANYSGELNISQDKLILDCQPYALFKDDGYGICVVHSRDANGSFLVNMRLEFGNQAQG